MARHPVLPAFYPALKAFTMSDFRENLLENGGGLGKAGEA